MSRTTRVLAASGILVLTSLSLTACGSDDTAGDEVAGGLENVTITGDFGTSPDVAWKGQVGPKGIETDVITEGDGKVIEEGDGALAQIWIGNGFTEDVAYSSYEAKAPQLLVGDLSAPFQEALQGQKVGSRVAVATNAEEAFGETGNPQLNIGNKDGVVFVVDLISRVADGPSGEEREPAKWAPSLVEVDDVITGLDFTDANKPSPKLLDTTLVKGDGPAVESGQTIAVDYLGQVYEADAPFDESFSADPASFPIGVGQVVAGWDKELVGKTVGSRVILSIPPADGYGDKGNKDAGIKGTDTLFFVIDILAAA